jgi:hypothetical protein
VTEVPAPSGIRLTGFLLLLLANCWLWMQGLHEFGHVVAAIASSGRVTKVVWHFAMISRTDVSPNPHPLFVCWAGPLLGCLLPLIASRALRRSLPLAFFTGFSLVANGAYVAVGSFDRVGDAGTLLQHGSPIAVLWIAGSFAIVTGFCIWHRMGAFNELQAWTVPGSQGTIQAVLFVVTVVLQVLLQ